MKRRTFIQQLGSSTLGLACVSCEPVCGAAAETGLMIQTVRGPIPAAALGPALTHEHVLVDFIGAEQVSPKRYDADEVFRVVMPHLRQIHDLGLRALFECTPAFLARDPRLLLRLSEASGLHLITNTGLYGARSNQFLPPYAHSETAEQLATRWTEEALNGIEGTGIRPGFIKTGVDPQPKLSPLHRKLISAAALTHLATGLTIASHTVGGPGLEEIDILGEHGVAPAAFIWVHAQGAAEGELLKAADRGAWISLDGLNHKSQPLHLKLCNEFKKRGQLNQVLLSHDAGWYDPAKPNGGTFRPYSWLSTEFIPLLRREGFSDGEIDQLIIQNPAAAFSIRVRKV